MKKANILAFIITDLLKLEQLKWSVSQVILLTEYFTLDCNFFPQFPNQV